MWLYVCVCEANRTLSSCGANLFHPALIYLIRFVRVFRGIGVIAEMKGDRGVVGRKKDERVGLLTGVQIIISLPAERFNHRDFHPK